jgi:nucleotide-binding universal stress UspA family protein
MKGAWAMLKKIIVAYDGSNAAQHAFRFALELATPFDATVIALSVAQLPEPATMVESSAMLEAATEHFEKRFVELRVAASAAGVALETQVVVGHAADQIVHLADEEKADLIVMGHRGKSLIQRWLLGSVSKRVISYAPCSVLIVR